VKVKQKDWTVAEDGWRRRMSTLSGLGPQDRRRSKGIRMLVLRRSPLTRQIVSGAFRYVNRLRPFAPNATVMQADFSPRARRESFSAPNAHGRNLSADVRFHGTMQKDGGPARRRPSSVNQEVAGSRPARGANYFSDFCGAPSVSTGSCAEACAETLAGSVVVRPSRRLTAVRRCSGARCA
jgi:hypothetical protein